MSCRRTSSSRTITEVPGVAVGRGSSRCRAGERNGLSRLRGGWTISEACCQRWRLARNSNRLLGRRSLLGRSTVLDSQNYVKRSGRIVGVSHRRACSARSIAKAPAVGIGNCPSTCARCERNLLSSLGRRRAEREASRQRRWRTGYGDGFLRSCRPLW